MISDFSFPICVAYGLGAVERLPAELVDRAIHRPMLVTGREMEGSPVLNRVCRLMQTCVLFAGIDAEPTEQNVLDGAETFVIEECDALVAVGDSRVMNASKAIRLKIHHPHPLSEYAFGISPMATITSEMPPLVTVPVLGGCGGEVSALATVVTRGKRKVTIQSKYLAPTLALVDPELSLTTSPWETAVAGMEALGYSVDAYFAKPFHPLCEALAADSVRLTHQHLPQAVSEGRNLEARSGLASASLLAGAASAKGGGLARSLATAISLAAGVADGVAMACVLPAVVNFLPESERDRIERLERLLTVASLTQALVDLRKQVGLDVSLRSLGIRQQDLADLAQASYADTAHLESPRACDLQDFRALYEQCW
ncbi:MAG: iron-containing alcohol dehydrogenase [Bryobacteraceae bacterium]|nr:iron-containing alcohol dehydrogenase [Bryobacteraceae bacterium]MDW8377235.1 iron-containing alcohol dehydrogenase [Bryobacterales bacterium]